MEIPSELIQNAVNEIAKLPGIGKKTALRLVLHLLKKDVDTSVQLSDAIIKLRTEIKYCVKCHNIADKELCGICASPSRDTNIICVVEDIQDVLAIENTFQYRGLYHVLGGVIAPMEGVGPSNLNIESLIKRVAEEGIMEVIFALSPTIDGDTTAYYLSKKLKSFNVKISTIARGIPIGGEIEYADEVTLGRSILSRVEYQ
jgi:recombination protein RecR